MKKPLLFLTLVLALLLLGNPAIRQTLAQTGVGNTAAELAGKFLMVRDADETVTGLKTYSRSTNPPFAVNSGAAKVTNLDADKLDGIDSTGFVQAGTPSTITTTGTATALALPSGLGPLVIYANNATLLTIQGIAAGIDGQQLTLISEGAGQVDLAHLNAGGTALGRVKCFATTGNTSLAAGVGTAVVQYDLANTRWNLIAHQQGDWIDYSSVSTITGSASWTTKILRYKLEGRLLSVAWYLTGTSNSASTSFTLPFTSVTITGGSFQTLAGITVDSGSYTATPGEVSVGSAATLVTLSASLSSAGSNWTASGTKTTAGEIIVNIQ